MRSRLHKICYLHDTYYAGREAAESVIGKANTITKQQRDADKQDYITIIMSQRHGYVQLVLVLVMYSRTITDLYIDIHFSMHTSIYDKHSISITILLFCG